MKNAKGMALILTCFVILQMLHGLAGVKNDESFALQVEGINVAEVDEETENVLRAREERLPVSFKRMVQYLPNGQMYVYEYDHTYSTFRFVNGYTSTVREVFLQDVEYGKIYQCYISYSFY